MSTELDKAIGHESPSFPVSWNQRDLLLYAVGVGAKRDELQFIYEDAPNWHALPTYPLVLALKGNNDSIVNFANIRADKPTPGLPKFDPKKVVHAEQSIEILGTLPNESGEGWTMNKKLVGIKDTGKGLIVDEAMELLDPQGKVVARLVSSSYNFGDFKTKGYAKSVAAKQPITAVNKPPQRSPDFVFSETVTPEQAAIYRLSGDYNPLHIDPEIGAAIGFGGLILHGLCSYGHAARAVILNAAKGDGRRLQYMSSRFTSPVLPGDELETSGWISTDEKTGGTRVDFVQKNKRTGKLALGGGVALLKGGQSKL